MQISRLGGNYDNLCYVCFGKRCDFSNSNGSGDDIAMTKDEEIAFLVDVVKAYQWSFLAIKEKSKYYPAMKKEMQVLSTIDERLVRFMEEYHKTHGKQYFPAVDSANRNNDKILPSRGGPWETRT